MSARILTIAESDASGSSGIQVDIKTVQALEGHAMTAVSLITPLGIDDAAAGQRVEPSSIAAQMRACVEGPGVDAIKVGFLQDEAAVNAVADVLDAYKGSNIPVIIDPSFVSRRGHVLADDKAVAAWKRRLYIHAKILTPNLREAETLTGMDIKDMETMLHAADMMRTIGVENIILKARQAFDDHEIYIVATDGEERIYKQATLKTHNTIGAGSAFSSALAVGLAQQKDVFSTAEMALSFLHNIIKHTACYPGHVTGALNYANFVPEEHACGYEPVRQRKL